MPSQASERAVPALRGQITGNSSAGGGSPKRIIPEACSDGMRMESEFGAQRTSSPSQRVVSAMRRPRSCAVRGNEAWMVFGWMSSTSPARQGQISLGASVRVTRRSRWLQGMCSTSQGDDRCVVHGDVGEGHPERGHHLAAKRKRTFVVVPRRGGLRTRAILDEGGVHPETHGSRAHESRDELAGDAVM